MLMQQQAIIQVPARKTLTRAWLRQRVRKLQKLGFSVQIEFTKHRGSRITLDGKVKGYRLKKVEAARWLEAFEDGILAGMRDMAQRARL